MATVATTHEAVKNQPVINVPGSIAGTVVLGPGVGTAIGSAVSSGVSSAVTKAENAALGPLSPSNLVKDIMGNKTVDDFLQRAGLMLFGGILLIVGIVVLVKDTQPAQAAGAAAKSAAKDAAIGAVAGLCLSHVKDVESNGLWKRLTARKKATAYSTRLRTKTVYAV